MKDDGGVAHNEWHPCACSPTCVDLTTRKMAPGHNMRLLGWLKRQMERPESDPQRMGAAAARQQALYRGASAGTMLRLNTIIRRGGFE